MSRTNGDRARFQKNRKRQIHLRARIRELVKRTREAAVGATAAVEPHAPTAAAK